MLKIHCSVNEIVFVSLRPLYHGSNARVLVGMRFEELSTRTMSDKVSVFGSSKSLQLLRLE